MRPGPLGPSVSLFTLPTVRHTAALISDEDGVSEYFHPFPYRFVTSDDGVRGSCACYSEREDVTAMVVESNMQLPQVQERYTKKLCTLTPSSGSLVNFSYQCSVIMFLCMVSRHI